MMNYQQNGGNDLRRQMLMRQIMGQGAPQPTNQTQGLMQGLNSIAGGFGMRNHNRGQFPGAPGGKPNFMQGLMNFFGKGGGGLY